MVTLSKAESELRKALYRFNRLFVGRKLYSPDVLKYKTPKQPGSPCIECGRPTSTSGGSSTCRECYTTKARAKYEVKKAAQDEKIRLANLAFNQLQRKLR